MKLENQLSDSNSPYLLQHKDNPVKWQKWSDKTFEIALKYNKPIFLSIGYSTCHWCHVMEHESFEDKDVANLLNKLFIPIKVDREEMPEVDHLYMSVCQAMTGHGGWPLTIVMTPKKEPFFAGTYFPKSKKGQRPGMLELLPSLHDAWINKKSDISQTTKQVKAYLNTVTKSEDLDAGIINDQIVNAFKSFSNRYDSLNSGFGKKPKFPSPHNLIFLIRYFNEFKDPQALQMSLETLNSMRKGGIFDHIGFGFHRYSTDEEWKLPHFEKMLYDQAMLSLAYIEAYQVTRNEEYSQVVKEVFEYVMRDLTSKEGGFYSAEDADSEGEEGLFYLWEKAEINNILGQKTGKLFCDNYNIESEGNYFDELTKKKTELNIPFLNKSQSYDKSLFNSSRKILLNERISRIRPSLDDKVLTDWNGLMIAALSKGGQKLNMPLYVDYAEKSAKFILDKLTNDDNKLLKRYRKGKAGIDPHLNDYSFFIWGLLNLYDATHKAEYLSSAITFCNDMISDFYDTENGGFFIGPKYAEKLIARLKDTYDGAIPSGNSVAVMVLFRLSNLTSNQLYHEIAENSIQAMSTKIVQNPSSLAYLLAANIYNKSNHNQIIIVGKKSDYQSKQIIKKLNQIYNPNSTIIFKDASNPKKINSILPWIKNYRMINDEVTIYVCKDFSCNLPVNTIEKILALLNNP